MARERATPTLFEAALVIWRHLPVAKNTKQNTEIQEWREGLREGRRRVFHKSSEKGEKKRKKTTAGRPGKEGGGGAGKLRTLKKKKISLHLRESNHLATEATGSDSSSERDYKKTTSNAHITGSGGGYYHYHLERIGAADD